MNRLLCPPDLGEGRPQQSHPHEGGGAPAGGWASTCVCAVCGSAGGGSPDMSLLTAGGRGDQRDPLCFRRVSEPGPVLQTLPGW